MTIYCILTILLTTVIIATSTNSTEDGKMSEFKIKEATVQDIRIAFTQNRLTSKQLVEFYLGEIERLNPVLKGVIEVNPDALHQAEKADQERKKAKRRALSSGMHGIPILLKDNIATKDKLNTTAGSFALLGSVVPRDAGVVKKLRKAGAVILGKASMSEWENFRGSTPNGWSARGGQAVNPYLSSAYTCGSSSGSAVSVAANMVAVSLGTETDGSILCPSNYNSVVGIKPTVGLTSRAGVIPISPRQDTVGPICRTVSDAVYVLDAIIGFDHNDDVANKIASKYIPKGGYLQFLKADGLREKRLGITTYPLFGFYFSDFLDQFKPHFGTLREKGAILVENLQVPNISDIQFMIGNNEFRLLKSEFKLALNAYLKRLKSSPVRSLADVIAFNNKHSDLEKMEQYDQEILLETENTKAIGEPEKAALRNLAEATQIGFEKLMIDNKLDALVTPFSVVSSVLGIGGFPGIIVPAGYGTDGVPYGICFGGLKGSEPILIEIAYGFEQATKIRRPPTLQP